MNEKTIKVFTSLQAEPEKMKLLLQEDKRSAVKEILGEEVLADSELDAVVEEVMKNDLIRLYTGAGGSIDPTQLMEAVGGFTADTVTRSANPGITALLDGKLDVNDLLAIASLLGGSSSSSNSTASTGNASASSILGSLFSQNSSSNALFTESTTPPVINHPQAPQQSTTNASNSLLSTLFGLNGSSLQQSAAHTGEQSFSGNTAQSQNTGFANLFNALSGTGQTVQNTAPSSNVAQYSHADLQNADVNTLVSLLLNNQNQSQTTTGSSLFTEASSQQFTTPSSTFNHVLNGSQSATNANGTVDVNSLFSIVSELLGK